MIRCTLDLGRALVPALLFALAGCHAEPATVLELVYGLVDEQASPHAPETPRACMAGSETRPALGCLASLSLGQRRVRADATGTAAVHLEMPEAARSRGALIEPLVKSGWGGMWLHYPSIRVDPSSLSEFTLRIGGLPPGKRSLLELRARPLPPADRRFETRPLAIGPRAELVLGLAVVSAPGSGDAPATRFRIVARTEQGEVELLDTTLSPGAAPGWRDHRVDLAAVAGKTARFAFVTGAASSEEASSGAGVPLWGSPLVLEPRPRDQRRSILLISLDTLRADHVGTERAGSPLTPGLDQLAAGGVVFEQAIAPYPSTTASHMSLFTGLYPVMHRVSFPTEALAEGIPTLPEVLARHGYVTAAYTENAMLEAGGGFARGFDSYWELTDAAHWAKGDVEATFGAALRWLKEHRGERFFVFLHTYQTHSPYDPPADLDALAESGNRSPADRYAGEVRYTDSVGQRLLDELHRLGELDSSIVVVTSDHGEEFGEHGDLEHARTLYEEVLRVPLILRAPGVATAGTRIAAQVSLVDLLPALLGLVGITPPGGVQGESLVPLLGGETGLTDRVAFAEKKSGSRGPSHLVSARTTSYKWIARLDQDAPLEVYDLRADPGETRSLSDPELRAQGEQRLAPYLELARRKTEDAPGRASQPGIARETERKLRALGYIE